MATYDEAMTTSRVVTLFLLLVMAILTAGFIFMNRTVLRGETSFDFGVVAVDPEGTIIGHTFELVNESGQPLTIDQIKPSCSCVSARAASREIPPGGTVMIHATLQLTESSRKNERIHVLFESVGNRRLHLKAQGRRRMPLFISTAHASLDDAGRGVVPLQLELWNDDDTPCVHFQRGLPIEVTIDEWKRIKPRNTKTGHPALWRTTVSIDASVVAPSDDQVITFYPCFEENTEPFNIPLRWMHPAAPPTGAPPASTPQASIPQEVTPVESPADPATTRPASGTP
jgi:hypothetical protein